MRPCGNPGYKVKLKDVGDYYARKLGTVYKETLVCSEYNVMTKRCNLDQSYCKKGLEYKNYRRV